MLIHKTKDQEVCGRIMATPGTMATVSHAIALHFLGEEIYSWEPETLSIELADTLDVQIDDDNLDRLNAIISAVTSNSFYKDWAAFTTISSVLNGENEPDEIAEMTVAEFAWAVVEVNINDGDDEPQIFSPDICSLVGVVLDQEGFSYAPELLSFAKMPEKYLGSTYGPEMNQEKSKTNYQAGLLEEYLKDQALLLYKQISMLPWLSEEDLEGILENFSSQISPVSKKNNNDVLYGV
jgi:hypothetical protein